jgi:hypothetical protein
MRTTFLVVLSLVLGMSAQAQTSVKPHIRKNGTVVMPHVRTRPDGVRSNNWSSRPNVNPYTGKRGARDPYRPATPKRYRY